MPTPEERVAKRRAEDKAFIMNYGAWPYWPGLPMKREGRTGVLVDRTPFEKDATPRFDFYPGANVYTPTSEWDKTLVRKNVNIDEFLAEGWMVD